VIEEVVVVAEAVARLGQRQPGQRTWVVDVVDDAGSIVDFVDAGGARPAAGRRSRSARVHVGDERRQLQRPR